MNHHSLRRRSVSTPTHVVLDESAEEQQLVVIDEQVWCAGLIECSVQMPSTSDPATVVDATAMVDTAVNYTVLRTHALQRLRKCMLIVYPGYVRDVDRALRRLGGVNEIFERHHTVGTLHCALTDDRAACNYDGVDARRECARGVIVPKGVTAQRRPASQSGHLMLVVRARRRRGQHHVDGNASRSEMSIVGLVHSVYEFRSMADYAYLPYRRVLPVAGDESAPPVYEELERRLMPTDIPSALNWFANVQQAPTTATNDDEQQTMTYMPSPLMSRYSFPTEYMLLPDITDHIKDRQKTVAGRAAAGGDQQTRGNRQASSGTLDAIGMCSRLKRGGHSMYIEGDEETWPTQPTPGAVAEADARIKDDSIHDALIRLFDERPMWTRTAITYHLPQCTEPMLKFVLSNVRARMGVHRALLPKYAFYVSSGPFGRLWCRFGYDARRDTAPHGRLYQIVGLTFRRETRLTGPAAVPRLAFGTTSSGAPVRSSHAASGRDGASGVVSGRQGVGVCRARRRTINIQLAATERGNIYVSFRLLANSATSLVLCVRCASADCSAIFGDGRGDRRRAYAHCSQKPGAFDARHGFLPPDALVQIRSAIKADIRAHHAETMDGENSSAPPTDTDDDDRP